MAPYSPIKIVPVRFNNFKGKKANGQQPFHCRVVDIQMIPYPNMGYLATSQSVAEMNKTLLGHEKLTMHEMR